ncbi:MAG TPA: hypothetical protein VH373_18290 [Jatrophihabitantaceae bacterium]
MTAGLAVAGLLLAGCADKVSGHASSAPTMPTTGSSTAGRSGGSATGGSPTAGSSSGGARPPTASSAPPTTSRLSCPNVIDLKAHLAYNCVTDAMTKASSPVWAFKLERPVDVNWTMDEGSADVTGAKGETPTAAAERMTRRMLDLLYGKPVPKTKTVQDTDISVGTAKGHLIQTLITIDPAYRKAQHLRVQQEQLWLVVLPVAPGKLSGWYTSIPDLLKAEWPNVPAVLKSLQVV